MDVEAMEAMIKVEEDVLAITIDEPSDLSTFIMPTNGHISSEKGFRSNFLINKKRINFKEKVHI